MEKQVKIISFANHKGGVGKTTTTASVGSILASMGNKVLLVDMDAQSNLTTSLLKDNQVDQTIYDALSASCRGTAYSLAIYPIAENLDIVPSSLRLASADLELSSVMAREHILADILKGKKADYDYILIDCPPSLGLLTLNAVTASDLVVIPLLAEVLPFQGLTMISDFVRMVKQKLNPKIETAGILLTDRLRMVLGPSLAIKCSEPRSERTSRLPKLPWKPSILLTMIRRATELLIARLS